MHAHSEFNIYLSSSLHYYCLIFYTCKPPPPPTSNKQVKTQNRKLKLQEYNEIDEDVQVYKQIKSSINAERESGSRIIKLNFNEYR